MFRPESIWQQIGEYAHNRSEPAATIVKLCSDLDAAVQAATTTTLALAPGLLALSPLRTASVAAVKLVGQSSQGGTLTDGQQHGLHAAYCSHWGPINCYVRLWAQFSGSDAAVGVIGVSRTQQGLLQYRQPAAFRRALVEFDAWAQQLRGLGQISWADRLLCRTFSAAHETCRALEVRGVRLAKHSWFLADPRFFASDEERVNMWFGRVEQIVLHTAPSTEQPAPSVAMLQVGASRGGGTAGGAAGQEMFDWGAGLRMGEGARGAGDPWGRATPRLRCTA